MKDYDKFINSKKHLIGEFGFNPTLLQTGKNKLRKSKK